MEHAQGLDGARQLRGVALESADAPVLFHNGDADAIGEGEQAAVNSDLGAVCAHGVELAREIVGALDHRGDEFVVAGERNVIGIHHREFAVGTLSLQSLDRGAHDALRECGPVHLADLPRRTKLRAEGCRRSQIECVMRDAMRLDVIGMAVATEVVVGHHDLRSHLANDRNEL